jgi:hypothetical protein
MPTFVCTLTFVGARRHACVHAVKGPARKINTNLRLQVILTQLQGFGTTQRLL